MAEVVLRLREATKIPIEAEVITPDRFAMLTNAEIAALPVFYGNRQELLGDLFEVRGERSDRIRIEGDVPNVKYIGAGMTRGRILIEGSVGMHLGSMMRGGEIWVEGDAGDWAGGEMQGGLISIRGNAGHAIGAGYRGSPVGMNRGTIVVGGNAGNEVGAVMRRGLIVVLGGVGDFVGTQMIAGTILVFGQPGIRGGAGMRRGSIVFYQPAEILPTFRYACVYEPLYLEVYLRHLLALGVPIPRAYLGGTYRRYVGDRADAGKGEILVYANGA